jgi:mono/diheme cytochrome c family protein
MLKRLFLIGLFTALTAPLGYSLDHPASKIVIPVEKTSPADGKQMFTSYCAPCHGVDGRGHGPVASSLKVSPADLSILSATNQGKFPEMHLVSVLRFGLEKPAHGTAAMPVWGPILSNVNHSSSMERDQRTSNLVRYLRTLQVR